MTPEPTAFARAAAALDAAPPPVSPHGAPGPDPDAVWDALRSVIDPEIGLDIVTLGLVYGVTEQGGVVHVRFTLTTPGCPMEAIITGDLVEAVSAVRGVTGVEPELVWEPHWSPAMIREGAW